MGLKAQDQAAPSVWLLMSAPFWVQLNMVVNGKRGKKARDSEVRALCNNPLSWELTGDPGELK